MRVLVADDDPAIRLLCRVNLEADGIEVVEADNGADALRVVETGVPLAAVLLDVMMPRLNGWRVAARLRASPTSRGVPVVFLTSVVDAEERARRFDAVVVTKPFDPITLSRIVREIATT